MEFLVDGYSGGDGERVLHCRLPELILPKRVSPKNHKYVFVLLFECKSILLAMSAPKKDGWLSNISVKNVFCSDTNAKLGLTLAKLGLTLDDLGGGGLRDFHFVGIESPFPPNLKV